MLINWGSRPAEIAVTEAVVAIVSGLPNEGYPFME
jgi:hypothetical protein